ncbi:pseudouridine synthase [Spirosoma oryzicola]|uniref:pseudouridine synthase n=1 Tax=Spirosoma oryzicola TaxID=2898794 RepID=UPI001E604E8D|nr:pseudouridine synthase [Spirosoma oryzicola]UHG91879.1 pseudouridine synthase [Spirosoma oryzicola]
MNQDSDKNDRRDGESRSFGRRDDGPRFNRASGSGNRNDGSRDTNSDRPRFNRNDGPRNDGPRNNDRSEGDRPRFNRDDKPRFDRNDGPRNDERPRFNRDDKRSDSSGDRRPRFDRDQNNDRPRFNRDQNNDRPRFNRDDKPRFDRNDNARGRRDDRSGDSRPNRNDERPRFNRDERPGFDRNNDRFGTERRFNDRSDERPRFDRDRNRFGNESNRSDNDRPRFNRNDGPRNDGPRNDDRSGNDRPRFDRNDESRNRSDRSGSRGNDRFAGKDSRFSRNRNDSSDKPAFKRVGGFNRDADERNRFGGDDQRDNKRSDFRSRDSQDSTPRFSPEQRKESGERRTGAFKKAPDYNLEQIRTERYSKPRNTRQKDTSERPDRSEADSGLTRLNRYIANSGVCSRREADELIARGDISVNGKVVTEMGYKVKDGDTVKYGTKILNPERFVYVLLNKPKDYITTTEDPEERKTVMELVADAGNFRMYPVGRLDRNTTGLLLLTNDGELADKLTHPSNNVRKIYQVEIDKPITDEHFEKIQQGITLEDGPIKPDAVSIVTPDAQVIGIEIHSGRNRIVRRIFEHLGYEVTKLDRTTYAGLTKKELPRGKWRFLDPKEVVKLKYFNN